MNSADRLRRIAAAAPQVLGDDGVWLAAAIEARLAGRSRTLDAALALTRRGGAPPAVQARNARRDGLLRAYATTFLGSLAPATQAHAMSEVIRDFESRIWPRLQHLAECPAHISAEDRRALFQLFKVGRVPNSPKQLGRILGAQDIQSGRLDVQPRAA